MVNVPEPFYAVDSRDWQVVQPNMEAMQNLGAALLCIEKDRPHVRRFRESMPAQRPKTGNGGIS